MLVPVSLIAVLALSHLSPAQDAVTVVRVFKEKDPVKYSFSMNANMGGQEMKGTAAIEGSVTKLLEKGKAELSISLKDLKLDVGGNNPPDTGAGNSKVILDSSNLPDSFPVEGVSFISGLWAVAGYVPNKALKPGEATDVKWEASDKTAALTGNCKLVEITDVKGVKTAKFEMKFAITPQSQGPGDVKLTTTVDVLTGALIEAVGSVEIGGEGTINFTFKKQ